MQVPTWPGWCGRPQGHMHMGGRTSGRWCTQGAALRRCGGQEGSRRDRKVSSQRRHHRAGQPACSPPAWPWASCTDLAAAGRRGTQAASPPAERCGSAVRLASTAAFASPWQCLLCPHRCRCLAVVAYDLRRARGEPAAAENTKGSTPETPLCLQQP